MAPMHSIAGINELYEQLSPTKLYYSRKTKTREELDATCRLCGEAQESVAHVLASCNALAQTKYLLSHNAAVSIIFFELLKVPLRSKFSYIIFFRFRVQCVSFTYSAKYQFRPSNRNIFFRPLNSRFRVRH